MISEAVLEKTRALAYAAVIRRLTASVTDVALDTKFSTVRVLADLDGLAEAGLIFRAPRERYVFRSWKVKASGSPSGASDASERASSKEDAREESEPKVPFSAGEISSDPSDHFAHATRAGARARGTVHVEITTPEPRVQVTRASLLGAWLSHGYKGNVALTKYALVGLFVTRWEDAFGIDYRPTTSYVRDVWCAEQLLLQEGDLSTWCIEALFDAKLSWLGSKSLEFLAKPAMVNKHVRAIAAGLRKNYGVARPHGVGAAIDMGDVAPKGAV